MAIGTDSTIHVFGTQDEVSLVAGTAAVSNTAFSVQGDVVSGGWTNDDDAPLAMFVLKFQYPSGTIVADGIHLFARLMNIQSTNDARTPSATFKSVYLGTFPTDSGLGASTNHFISLGPVVLPNFYTSQLYEFYIQNDCDVTMTAGWQLWCTPMTYGPHP